MMEMDEVTELPIYQTKQGEPAIWEEGGATADYGFARIIAGKEGEPLKPIYIRRKRCKEWWRHALLLAYPGLIIIDTQYYLGLTTTDVWRIVRITDPHPWANEGRERPGAVVSLVAEYRSDRRDGWRPSCPEWALPALLAAGEKANCYDCRRPHYIAKRSKRATHGQSGCTQAQSETPVTRQGGAQ
jgi:hypothetical protein